MKTSVHRGRTFGRSENGATRTVTVTGTLAEMTAYLNDLDIGSGYGGEHISNANASQVSGDQWQCVVTYTDESNGGITSAPSSAYGKKSAALSAGAIRMPLEHHKDYLANWNHYLVCGERTGQTLDLPDWHETAAGTILSADLAKQYKWVKSAADVPTGKDRDGRTWRILANPAKPGVEGYDLATYQVTESVKQPSATRCGTYVANRLNKIVSPDETFGITGGNWKCDRASIGWDGKHWKATLSYTKSGDDSGWDTDLYEEG